jgi:hypothetical protein
MKGKIKFQSEAGSIRRKVKLSNEFDEENIPKQNEEELNGTTNLCKIDNCKGEKECKGNDRISKIEEQ